MNLNNIKNIIYGTYKIILIFMILAISKINLSFPILLFVLIYIMLNSILLPGKIPVAQKILNGNIIVFIFDTGFFIFLIIGILTGLKLIEKIILNNLIQLIIYINSLLIPFLDIFLYSRFITSRLENTGNKSKKQ